MSAEQPDPDTTAPGLERPRSARPGPALVIPDQNSPSSDLPTGPTSSEPLSTRIERTRLRLQVAALERALETSERRQQAVIDRYERLLEDRSSPDDSTPESRSRSPLDRVLEALS